MLMRVTLRLTESLEENAQRYFEAAKKARKKAKGAEKALREWRAKLARQAAEPAPGKDAAVKKPRRKKEWFEQFRWCLSSDGLLMVGGRDATTNEQLVKKHAEKGDLVFHTDMAGAPFVIVKAGGKEVPSSTVEEAAQFCASFSRAWRSGMSSLEVFHVSPEQVTKEANTGEHLGKGAFMIRGKTTYHKPLLGVAVGVDAQGRVMSGPPRAVATLRESSGARAGPGEGERRGQGVAAAARRRHPRRAGRGVAAGRRAHKVKLFKGGPFFSPLRLKRG